VRILHLSDCHVPRQEGADDQGLDARAILAGMLRDCDRVDGLDLVVVSGDVADDASREGYAAALDLIGGFARSRGIPQAYCTGNHDRREAFGTVLGSGHFDQAGQPAGTLAAGPDGPRAAVSEVAGYRIITLDSLVPGETPGYVSPDQLTWLRDLLSQPAPAGSVVILHHPPVAPDREPQRSVGLRNAADLAAVLTGSDVRAVLCGHFHSQLAGRLGEVPVWVSPGIITRIDWSAPPGSYRVVRGAAATVIELDGPGSPMFQVLDARDPRAGEFVGEVDTASWMLPETG
jgi:3',5'-cyclic AMP phosphodiesterase CpdA